MSKIQEIVSDIQEKIYDENDKDFHLSYTEIGYVEIVRLYINCNGISLIVDVYNSENDDREWIEEIGEYEDFSVFLLKKINLSIVKLYELRGIL